MSHGKDSSTNVNQFDKQLSASGKGRRLWVEPPVQSSSGTVPGDGGHTGTCPEEQIYILSARLQKQNQTS